MSCTDGIVKKVVSDCTTAKGGGLEVIAWVFNRLELTPTYDNTYPNLINSLAMVGAATGFHIEGVKKLLDAGHKRVIKDNRPDKFTHVVKFQQFEFSAADLANIDNAKDLVIVVESKDKPSGSDGVFQLYGMTKGLWVSADDQMANTENGARILELSSMADQEESVSHFVVLDTDYATTKALLESLM
jgi:hypothetical protein